MWADTLIGTVVSLVIAVSALPLLWQSAVRLRSRPQTDRHAPSSLQEIGWLEAGQADLSRLVTK